MVMAVGGILAPQIVRGLLLHFSHQTSIIAFGALISSGLLGSALFFPVAKNTDQVEAETNLKPCGDSTESKWKQNPIVKVFMLINWSLLKNGHFLLTILGSSYTFNALLSFYLYLPLHAKANNLILNQKSALLSIVAGIDLLTR